MTDARTYDTPDAVAREKQFPIRITLPMTAQMQARLDATVQKEHGEDRVSVIRKAIEAELKRRERQKS